MSHEDYKDIGNAEDRLIEECSELIQIIAKAKRFGLDSHHPKDPSKTNRDLILAEMEDVRDAISEYRGEIYTYAYKKAKCEKSKHSLRTIHGGCICGKEPCL